MKPRLKAVLVALTASLLTGAIANLPDSEDGLRTRELLCPEVRLFSGSPLAYHAELLEEKVECMRKKLAQIDPSCGPSGNALERVRLGWTKFSPPCQSGQWGLADIPGRRVTLNACEMNVTNLHFLNLYRRKSDEAEREQVTELAVEAVLTTILVHETAHNIGYSHSSKMNRFVADTLKCANLNDPFEWHPRGMPTRYSDWIYGL